MKDNTMTYEELEMELNNVRHRQREIVAELNRRYLKVKKQKEIQIK